MLPPVFSSARAIRNSGVIGLLLEGRAGGHATRLGDGLERVGPAPVGSDGRMAIMPSSAPGAKPSSRTLSTMPSAPIIGGEVAALDGLLQHGLARAVGVGEDDEVGGAGRGQLAELGAVFGLAFFMRDVGEHLAAGGGVGSREIVGEALAVVVVHVGDADVR